MFGEQNSARAKFLIAQRQLGSGGHEVRETRMLRTACFSQAVKFIALYL